MWCWRDTFIHCLFSHVLDTVARPYFSICLLWRHNPNFLLKQECRPASGLSTLQSLEMDLASLTEAPPLSALPIFDLYQSSPLTPQHAMPVWPECVLSEPLGERMSFGCSAFLGPYSWNACKRRRKGQMLYISGRLGLIPVSCLIVKICNILISSWPNFSQPWHWDTT